MSPNPPQRQRPQQLPLLLNFDLDRTLVHEQEMTLQPETVGALQELHDLGVKLAVITGRDRVPEGISKAAPFNALASHNGGQISVNGKAIVDLAFSEAEVAEIIAHELEGVRIILYSKGELFIHLPEGHDVPHWVGERAWSPFEASAGKPIEKIGFFHENIVQHAEKLRLTHPHLTITGAQEPYMAYLAITPAEAHKGAGMLRIADELGVPHTQTIAFGDADNDRTMLQLAGYGVRSGDLALLADVADESVSGPEDLTRWLQDFAAQLKGNA